MIEKVQDKSIHSSTRPCFARSLSMCSTTFLLAFLAFLVSAEVTSNNFFFITIGIVLLLTNIALSIYCIFKLNSRVYVTDTEISQRQFRREITVKYDDITDVKLTHSPIVKAPPLVTLSNGNTKICFETTSRVYKSFKESCKNERVNEKLRKVLKDHLIYD